MIIIDKEALTAHIYDMEQKQKIKKVLDLCEQSIRSHTMRHTKFLTPNQILLLQNILPQIPDISYQVVQPNTMAERQIIYFYPTYIDFEEVESATSFIKLSPIHAEESLTHRDFLGAIMSLGIERENIGDIVFDRDAPCVYIVLLKPFDQLLLLDIQKVRNTKVFAEVRSWMPDLTPELEEQVINVASLRLDGVVAGIINLSREKTQKMIQRGDVKVNFEEVKDNSKQLAENDVVSIRKFGKYRMGELLSETRKKRCRVRIFRYTN